MRVKDLCRLFFLEWGLPYVRSHYPQLETRVAAGLFERSQAIEADDELSRDHDWGPSFQLFLTDDDFDAVGKDLYSEITREAPDEWRGCRHSFKRSMERITVDPITGYFKGQLECGPPACRTRLYRPRRPCGNPWPPELGAGVVDRQAGHILRIFQVQFSGNGFAS